MKFFTAALATAVTAFAMPTLVVAQDHCAGLSSGGRSTCYAISGYNTRQQAFQLTQTISADMGRQLDAKQFAKACTNAESLVQLHSVYLPDMLLKTLELRHSICSLR